MRRLVALAMMLAAVSSAAAAAREADVDAVGAELRCVVCQNLSVKDSPSEMARQMRDLIRERLERGDTPEAVRAYFVERYGEWVLLAPPTRGAALLAWVLPLAALGGGIAIALVVLARWSRRGAAAARDSDAAQAVDDAALAAVREELRRRTE